MRSTLTGRLLVGLSLCFLSSTALASYDLTLDEEELDFLQRINAYRAEIGARA